MPPYRRSSASTPDEPVYFSLADGRISLTLRAMRLGDDLQVMLCGGRSHIGGVAVARPDEIKAYERMISLPGHREAMLALRMARRLAKELRVTVCVSAGIHYDAISPEEIGVVERLADSLTTRLLRQCQGGI